MAGLKPDDIERESLKDLKILVERAEEWKVETVVIGGYAVRAFTNAYRHTKDIDMAVAKEEKGNFTALLKSLKYELRDTEFGLAASKKFDSDFIDVHISVGKIYDMSTKLSYPITRQLFDEKQIMLVRSRYDVNKKFETKSPIVDLNTLIILKLIPKGRPEKDAIDIISLMLDQVKKIDIANIVKKCKEIGLTDYIRSQIQEFARKINNGEMDRLWSDVTGTKMTGVQRRSIQKFLRELDSSLKSS
ncbi:MAG: nucleotidyltransferase domain-containing protein [Nitrosopumilaceae archaeon]